MTVQQPIFRIAKCVTENRTNNIDLWMFFIPIVILNLYYQAKRILSIKLSTLNSFSVLSVMRKVILYQGCSCSVKPCPPVASPAFGICCWIIPCYFATTNASTDSIAEHLLIVHSKMHLKKIAVNIAIIRTNIISI